jgi:uncharacterized protein (TIGR03437 family)
MDSYHIEHPKAFPHGCAAILPGFVISAVLFGAEISMPEQTAAVSAAAIAPVLLDAQGSQIAGVQFDITWDDTALDAGVVTGDRPRIAGKNIYSTMLHPNSLRCLLAGYNQQVLADGELLRLFLFVHPSAAPGSYEVKFSNVLATDQFGQAIPLSGVTTHVNVQAGPAVNSTILPSGGVMNAASMMAGPVAPGEIISLLGPGTAMLSSTENGSDLSVVFDGARAPVVYIGPHQINAAVPFSVGPETATTLEVRAQNRQLATITLPVAAATPGLFTQDASGAGPAEVFNEDASVNTSSNPADRGSMVTFFGTGFGPTTPAGVDGEIAAAPASLLQPAVATIGGRDADVLYAGAAPGLIAGVTKINVRVPIGADSGIAVPVVLRVGGAVTQAGVTLSVR